MQVELAGNYEAQWGEGPIWYDNVLYYVDIEGHKVIRFDPATGDERIYDVGERVGTVVPRAKGGLVIAGDTGFHFLDSESGELTAIADPEPEIETNRFNDGKCDPSGRFWAGTISTNKTTGAARLYCLDAQLKVSEKFGPVTNSNGICWSLDAATMYYIDTPRKQVLAFDFDNAAGEITNERVVIDTQEITGSPDGMTIDAEGMLWVAFCRGSNVHRFDPATGKMTNSIELPCTGVTAVAFGGPNMDVLYVTTGKFSNAPETGDGRLYMVHLDVHGQASFAFSG